MQFLFRLPPSMRPGVVKALVEALAREGRLCLLEVPTYKEPATGGRRGSPTKIYAAHLPASWQVITVPGMVSS